MRTLFETIDSTTNDGLKVLRDERRWFVEAVLEGSGRCVILTRDADVRRLADALALELDAATPRPEA